MFKIVVFRSDFKGIHEILRIIMLQNVAICVTFSHFCCLEVNYYISNFCSVAIVFSLHLDRIPYLQTRYMGRILWETINEDLKMPPDVNWHSWHAGDAKKLPKRWRSP